MSVSRFEPQGLRSAKVTTNLKFYLQKYLVLDKKQIKYSQLLQEKSIFVSSRKQPKEITMKKFKTKAIQADKGIFTHILAYSDIFKHKQSIGIFRTLCIPGIFRTLVYTEQKPYSEPWYIENRGILRTLVYSGLSLSRTGKGPTNLFKIEKVRDRENYLKNQKFY